MHIAAITYRDSRLEAREQDDMWTVRLAHLEARARYLDLALVELLGNAPDAHRAAARLLAELADLVEQQKTADLSVATAPRRESQHEPDADPHAKPVVFAVAAFAFLVVAVTAFMLTTLLTTLQ